LQEMLVYPFSTAPADFVTSYKTYTKKDNDGLNRVVVVKPPNIEIETGQEFPKTDSQFFGNHSVDMKCLCGEGFVLLQKQAVDNQGYPLSAMVEDFSIIRIRKGDALTIPPYYYIRFVNIKGKTNYFTIEDDSLGKVTDDNLFILPDVSTYELLNLQGFAYDVVKGVDGNPALKKNMFYREIKEKFLGGLSSFPTE